MITSDFQFKSNEETGVCCARVNRLLSKICVCWQQLTGWTGENRVFAKFWKWYRWQCAWILCSDFTTSISFYTQFRKNCHIPRNAVHSRLFFFFEMTISSHFLFIYTKSDEESRHSYILQIYEYRCVGDISLEYVFILFVFHLQIKCAIKSVMQCWMPI